MTYEAKKDAKLVWAGGTYSITAENEGVGRALLEAAVAKAAA